MNRRQEVRQLQQFYQEQKSGKAEYERMHQALIDEENEKKWAKQEAQWRREDQARINLLKNVYQNREADIELKKKLKDESKWLVQNEKGNLDAEVERQNEAFATKTMADAMTRKQHQTDILR